MSLKLKVVIGVVVVTCFASSFVSAETIATVLNVKLFDASIITLFDAKKDSIIQNIQWKWCYFVTVYDDKYSEY